MKAGDIILVHSGRSILARGITYYMKLYLKSKGFDPDDFNFIPHHAGTIIDVWGELHVAEAVGRGYVVQPLLKAYSLDEWEQRVEIYEPVKSYTKQQQEDISKMAIKYSLSGVPYDYLNFIYQIGMIKFGRWFGPRGQKAENRFYCSEVTATLAEKIQPGSFPNPAATNPVDILLSGVYKI